MNPIDLTCRLMRSAVRFGVYTDYVQHRVVQAQYYKDPRNLQGLLIDLIGREDAQAMRNVITLSNEQIIGYLDHNVFLPDINNELGVKNETYRDNLSQLEYFIMVRFADDSMVKPSETAVSKKENVSSPFTGLIHNDNSGSGHMMRMKI